MKDSIRLHPKHGLNPTMPVCWWCGKQRNEVALLGAAYKGEAPMQMIIDRVPCSDCAANQAKGITLIEAIAGTRADPQPTGNWCVITEDAAKRFFNHDPAHRSAYIEPAAWDKLGLPRGKPQE